MIHWLADWWFGTWLLFPCIGKNHPNWLIFFRGIETTNKLRIKHDPLLETIYVFLWESSNVKLWLITPPVRPEVFIRWQACYLHLFLSTMRYSGMRSFGLCSLGAKTLNHWMTGWWFGTFGCHMFPFSWEFHGISSFQLTFTHSMIFQRGRRKTTKPDCY